MFWLELLGIRGLVVYIPILPTRRSSLKSKDFSHVRTTRPTIPLYIAPAWSGEGELSVSNSAGVLSLIGALAL